MNPDPIRIRNTVKYILKFIFFFQSGANKTQEKVVFIGESSGEADSVVVEGDPGQGRQEDRDLYTTRTA